jgi:ABC-type nitrate/sulfonate/bicarbonate transport system permease component
VVISVDRLEPVPAGAGTLEAALERRLTGAARRRWIWRVVLPVLVAIPALLGWQLYAWAMDNPLIPTPTKVAGALGGVLDHQVLSALVNSDLSLLLGYLAAVVIGVPLGLLMGRVRVADDVLGPVVDLAMVTPMVVVMPVVLIALGLSRQAQVVTIFIFAVPLVIVPCRAGAKGVSPNLLEMAKAFGASGLRIWREVLLPGSVPAIVTGLRLGFGQAITGMVVVELTLLAIGIGNVILDYQASFRAAQMFAVVGLIVVQSVVVMAGLRLLGNRVAGSVPDSVQLEQGVG